MESSSRACSSLHPVSTDVRILNIMFLRVFSPWNVLHDVYEPVVLLHGTQLTVPIITLESNNGHHIHSQAYSTRSTIPLSVISGKKRST